MKPVYSLAIALLLAGCGARSENKVTSATKDSSHIPTPYLSQKEYDQYHQMLTQFFESTLLRGRFNGVILVAKNGVPVYENYHGLVNFSTRDSLTPSTALQIASTSKPFTAAAVLRLVAEGKIGLNDFVTKYFPGFPYTEVTVKMLLNHRSGLPNYLNFMDVDKRWDRQRKTTNEDVLNSLLTWNVTRAYRPNTHFNYCNTNYVILASIVEKVSGVPFPQYVKQYIFDPLGMKDTYVSTLSDSARSPLSYNAGGGIWRPDFSDGPYGDKNIYSTPRDLLKWDQAWYTDAVLPQALRDSAFTPYSNERPGTHNYGLGWRLLLLPNGKKIVYHNGRWHGFTSAFARLTDENVTIIILSNRFNKSVYNVSRQLYNLFGRYEGKVEIEE